MCVRVHNPLSSPLSNWCPGARRDAAGVFPAGAACTCATSPLYRTSCCQCVLQGKLPLEAPRPVVTYMMRNFFSRRVLNDHDILRYVLERYNVTLRVTTFEVRGEPRDARGCAALLA